MEYEPNSSARSDSFSSQNFGTGRGGDQRGSPSYSFCSLMLVMRDKDGIKLGAFSFPGPSLFLFLKAKRTGMEKGGPFFICPYFLGPRSFNPVFTPVFPFPFRSALSLSFFFFFYVLFLN
jgi:hypothetical protein